MSVLLPHSTGRSADVAVLILLIIGVSSGGCHAKLRQLDPCVFQRGRQPPSPEQCVKRFGLPLDEAGARCVLAATYPSDPLSQCHVQFYASTNEAKVVGVVYEDCAAGRGGGRILYLSRATGDVVAEGTFASDIDCGPGPDHSPDDTPP